MSLATRVIPVVLCRHRQMVKGRHFNSWRSVGLAAQAVRIHNSRSVDELVLLDVGATPESRSVDIALVSELADEVFSPLTVGGGVRTLADVRALLRAGADKVVIGTAAVETPRLVSDAAMAVGCQAVVVAIDVRGPHVWTHCGGRENCVGPVELACNVEALGAGEILLTSIEREGDLCGYDLELVKAVSTAVNIPVVANGGCGSYEDMISVLEAGAHAVAAGALWQFSDATPREAKRHLHEHGVRVRL